MYILMFLLLLGFLFKREAQQLTLCKCNELLLSLFARPDFFLLSFTGCANSVFVYVESLHFCICMYASGTNKLTCMYTYICIYVFVWI